MSSHTADGTQDAAEALKILQRQNELLAAVGRAQELFISGQDPSRVYGRMLDILVKATGSACGFLDEVLYGSDETPYKRSLALSDISWDDESRRLYQELKNRNREFRDLNNLSGAPILEGKAVIANNALQDPRSGGLPEGHPPIVRYMGIPLFYGEKIIGVVGVANRPDDYSKKLAEFIRPLTQACGAMIWAGRVSRRERENLAALRRSEEKYRRLAENMTDVVWTADLDFRTTYASPSVERLLGEPVDAHIQRTLEEKLPPDSLQKLHDVFAEELEKEKSPDCDKNRSRLIEVQHYRPDGSLVWIDMHISFLRDEAGNPVGFLGVSRDITARKQVEREREKLQSLLFQTRKLESVGRLAGGVAHDYNNMLSVILGYAEMALEKVDAEDPLHEDLSEILSAGRRSSDVTRQLLAFARRQTVSPKALDVNEAVEGMLEMLRCLTGDEIELLWRPGKSVWPVYMDPARFEQILANLCVNAREAVSVGGRIVIETKTVSFDAAHCSGRPGFKPGQYVLLSVSDDGKGMDEATLANLFDPFFTTKGWPEGTGLGLSTVYGMVGQDGGFVDVTSEPGKGTVFRIYLPRYSGGAANAGKTAGPEKLPRLGKTVLLVEDDPSILKIAKKMLESMDCRVLASTAPGEAVNLAKEHAGKIHLLITDVVMTGMDGRDLAKGMKALYPELKVLFMSGYTAHAVAHRRMLEEGACFVQKPFSRKELAAKVIEALEG